MMIDGGYAYVDVRSVPEFEAGHPQGAVNIPLANMVPGGMVPNPAFLPDIQKQFAEGREARRSAASPAAARCRPRRS